MGRDRQPQDSAKFAAAIEQCKAGLLVAYGYAEKRYGADPCSSSGRATEMNSELDEATQRVGAAF